MKKNKNTLIHLMTLSSIVALASPLLITSCSKSSSKTDNDDTGIKWDTNENRKDFINDDVFSIGTNNRNVINEESRQPQTQYYNSECWEKYHDQYEFVYPSQKYNYRDHESNGTNVYFGPNRNVEAYDAVMNEFVIDENGNYVTNSNGEKIRYNNVDWIKSEIQKGTFKKHRAADDMYLNKYDNVKSQTTEFVISTATKGSLVLGLFAPAGEVIEITFSDKTWDLIKNNRNIVDFVINENFWDNKDKNNSGRISNRYPFIESHFGINENEKTLKIGTCFGGGISLNIKSSLNNKNSFPIDAQALDLEFTIKGAIPCVFYQDGVTTEKEWEEQLQKIETNQIAPILQASSAYFSLTIPFTDKNKIGHKTISELVYPKKSFKKWNDFLYLSNYFAGRDLDNNIQRLNMEYCDDIWDGAAAWGGGMAFYCPTEWGTNAMFNNDPDKVFNAYNSWGVFHEINHNFEQNDALFNKRSHGETNIVNGFNLSVISDSSRNRSELNWTGDPVTENNAYVWSWLTTPFSIISQFPWRIQNNATSDFEYPLYMLILCFVGSKNFADYVRKDIREHPANTAGWTGLKEIERICDTFKLNLWPFFEYFGKYWRDTWPESYSSASLEEKQIIDNLYKKYKSVEMVACQYASGQYLYDQDTNSWNYAGDTLAPFQIPAFMPYTLKLDEMVKGLNPNFKWDEVRFETKTKLGGSLSKDPNNSKRLIYTPNNNKVDQIDEFDISIIPGTWNNKPRNYIDQYKFKIKIRQVVNQPTLETFDIMDNNLDINDSFEYLKNAKSKNIISLGTFQNTSLYFEDQNKRGIRVKFDFVALESGDYTFENKWDDYIKVFINDKLQFSQNSYENNFREIYSINLNKGDRLHFEYLIINNSGVGNFDFNVKLNNKSIDFNPNLLTPKVDDKYLNNNDYQFNPRTIDRNIFDKSLTSAINLSSYSTNIIDPSCYHLSSPQTGDLGNNPDPNIGMDEWLNWSSDKTWFDGGIQDVEINVDFKQLETIRTIFIGNGEWTSRRPTYATIYGYDANGKEILLFKDNYPTRESRTSYIILNQTLTVKKLKLLLDNKDPIYKNGFDYDWIAFSKDLYTPFGPSFAFNNQLIKISKNWEFFNNNQNNSSALNNIYVVSKKENDQIEFTLNNSYGFSLIGQSNNSDIEFDIYINDKLYQTVKPYSATTLYNQSLFDYKMNVSGIIKVKIVNKKSTPLYLNYIMTFGDNIFLS